MIFLLLTYREFIRDLEGYRVRAESLQAKQIISADLNSNLEKIKLFYYRTMLTSNKEKVLDINMALLRDAITQAKELIAILEHGGIYQKKLQLNIAGQDLYAKSYYYPKPEFSIEAIRLKPKIVWLSEKSYYLERLMQKRIDIMKQHQSPMEPLSQIRNKISLFTKSINSIFKRMEEDSNKLFYVAQKELGIQKLSDSRTREHYNFLIYSAVLLLLLNILLGLYFLIKILRHKLYVDDLTQLYSRVKLEETIFDENALLLLVDIDDFSDINSLYGIEVGDGVLQHFSQKIKDFDPSVEHFRVAGDVFALYYMNATHNTDAIVAKIKALQWYLYHSHCPEHICQAEISVTVGAAIGKHCLHDAFMALDIANTKHEPYRIFSDESDFKKEIEFNRLWHNELSLALENDSVIPFFQPIVNQDMRIIKYEALMRLGKIVDGEIVYIPPIYLDVAVKTKQYLSLSQSMIKKTFIQFADETQGAFSINISYQDINTQTTRDFLKKMIVEHGVAGRVTFEILESSFIDSYDLLKIFIAEFQAYGAKFAIDDFGSGYSNAKRVVNLNPDYIKIDGELIKHMLDDRKSYKMVENIISYAKEFHITTIAEHVSSMELFKACKKLEIDYFQGYLFAKPAKELQTQVYLNE